MDMSLVTQCLVALAALIYITKETDEYLQGRIRRVIRRYNDELALIHDKAAKELEVTFDLWWSGEPVKVVRATLLSGMVFPVGLEEGESDPMLEVMLAPVVDTYRGAAFHVAVHACIRSREDKLIAQIKGAVSREIVRKQRDVHHEALEADRATLVAVGIDVERLEAEFHSA